MPYHTITVIQYLYLAFLERCIKKYCRPHYLEWKSASQTMRYERICIQTNQNRRLFHHVVQRTMYSLAGVASRQHFACTNHPNNQDCQQHPLKRADENNRGKTVSRASYQDLIGEREENDQTTLNRTGIKPSSKCEQNRIEKNVV